MYDPYRNANGSDTQLGQYEKMAREGHLNPHQRAEYDRLKAQADASDPIKIAERQLAEKTAAQRAETDARFATNKQELTDYTNRLQTKVPEIVSGTYSKYGIPDQVNAVNALRTRVNDLRGNESGSGAGGYASAGQVEKNLNINEIPRFNTAVSNLNTSAGIAQGEIGTLTQPLYTEGSIISDRIAREFTGYSQLQQRELDTLLAKHQAGVQMAENEKNRLHQLAQLEKQFEVKKYEMENSQKQDNRYLSGSSFFDTQTNKWITAPKVGISNSGW